MHRYFDIAAWPLSYFGGRILLDWIEPDRIVEDSLRKRSPLERFWYHHGGSIKTGCFAGLLIAIFAVLKTDDFGYTENWDDVLIIAAACSAAASGVLVLLGFLSERPRRRVYLKEQCVMCSGSSGSSTERWDYSELDFYAVDELDLDDGIGRLLILISDNEEVATFEVDPNVSEEEIHHAMEGKLPLTE